MIRIILVFVWMMAAVVHLWPASAQGLLAGGTDEEALIDLVNSADRIVRGTVTGVDSRYASNENGDHFIVSTVVITVAENLKGRSSQGMSFQTVGGTVGDITMGSSEYDVVPVKGDHVLVMLVNNSAIPYGLLKLDESGETIVGHSTVAQVRAALKGK